MKLLSIFILLGISIACFPKQERPNVIVVITDDQGYGDIACNGNTIIKTPKLDAFSAEAYSFTNYHVGTTCAPTRAGLLTGRNCNRNGVWHTIGGCSLLNKREVTFANVFADAGYKTMMIGKWHLGDNHPFLPHDRGFQESYYHGGGGVGQTPDYWLNDYMDDTYFRNGKPEKAQGYCTDVFFDEAIGFIERNKKKTFLCYLSLNAPHGPFNVPEKYYRMYEAEDAITETQKRFYAMISNIDENFAKLDQKLADLGIADNTILIFTTDNGTAAGIATNKKTEETLGYNAGMRGKKSSQYDGGHRVPFIMRWKNGKYGGGKTFDELIAHVDFLPTIAACCDIPFTPVNALDGKDMSPYIKKNKAPHRYLVTDTQRNQWPEKGRKSCVMSTEWRLVDGNELYNIKQDVGQEHNLIAQYPERANEMQDFYDTWWADASQEFEYSYIEIGHEKEELITCHDVHIESQVAWNHKHIRKGDLMEVGDILVEFVKDGTYEFTLRRWPKESNLALGAPSNDKVAALPWWDGQANGNALDFTSAFLQIGDQKAKADVDSNKNGITFQLKLKAGKTKLKAAFVTDADEKSNAFYIDVKQL